MGRVEKRRQIILSGKPGAGLLLFFVLFVLYGLSVRAASDDYKIEQVYINKPEVTAYYRTADPGGEVMAYLNGKLLTLTSNELFSDTGEGVEYYIMIDVSASIPSSRFADIRESMTQFVSGLRDMDSLILVTFGEEILTVLNGSESREDAINVIAGLQNPDQDTLLFEAIDRVADMIAAAADNSRKRRVMVILSDGKDCADDTRSVETVEATLTAQGIPVYTLAVENNEGDTQAEVTSYRGKFSSLARNTGGVAWVVSDEENVLSGLEQMRSQVLGSYRAVFQASSNKVSNTNEDFVMKFTSAGNVTDILSVLVERGQADTVAPQITRVVMEELNEICISFSEKVQNASDISNYSVKKDGRSIPVQQVQISSEEENSYVLIFGSDLYSGQYTITVNNVTDDSNEENALANPVQTVALTGLEQTELPETETQMETETEPVTEAELTTETDPETESETEAESETETETESQAEIGERILKWWPVVLTVIFLILILVILLIYRGIKKKKGVLFIDGHVVTPDKIEEKVHVAVDSASDLPRKKVTLWLSNGRDEVKRVDKLIESSLIVGRSTQCDIYCDDPLMSRQHFILEVENGNVYVTDLQTRNGTSVNGVSIPERYRLSQEDEITAGSIKFRITWE
ncbi:MAG: FHA domain-containing protein [Clostridiales bacterium]|nr:FHA domain-containing protein [Clostridiales bacterium]